MTPASPAAGRVAIHVCGSVAAYKACEVITALRKQGCEVRVAMTRSARHFVTETTLQSLSGHAVARTIWQPGDAGHGMGHIDIGSWAETHAVVAASANLLARLAHGFADDAVTATLLATRAPLIVAPAMESAMWEHPATQANVATLRNRRVSFVGPVRGRLASGAEGDGRMAEVDEVVAAILTSLREAAPG